MTRQPQLYFRVIAFITFVERFERRTYWTRSVLSFVPANCLAFAELLKFSIEPFLKEQQLLQLTAAQHFIIAVPNERIVCVLYYLLKSLISRIPCTGRI